MATSFLHIILCRVAVPRSCHGQIVTLQTQGDPIIYYVFGGTVGIILHDLALDLSTLLLSCIVFAKACYNACEHRFWSKQRDRVSCYPSRLFHLRKPPAAIELYPPMGDGCTVVSCYRLPICVSNIVPSHFQEVVEAVQQNIPTSLRWEVDICG